MSKEEGGAGGGGSGGAGEPSQAQYVGPYRLDKTLGKGQTGRNLLFRRFSLVEDLYKPKS